LVDTEAAFSVSTVFLSSRFSLRNRRSSSGCSLVGAPGAPASVRA
jgi:hypothetical protein